MLIVSFYHKILQKDPLKDKKMHMYIWQKVYNNVMKMIISRAQHTPTPTILQVPLQTKTSHPSELSLLRRVDFRTLSLLLCRLSLVPLMLL